MTTERPTKTIRYTLAAGCCFCSWGWIMPADDILLDTEERMEKAISVLKNALGGIRTGRANPGLVDSLRVEVYGSPTPMKQVAAVGAPEPQQIVIRPFDPGTI